VIYKREFLLRRSLWILWTLFALGCTLSEVRRADLPVLLPSDKKPSTSSPAPPSSSPCPPLPTKEEVDEADRLILTSTLTALFKSSESANAEGRWRLISQGLVVQLNSARGWRWFAPPEGALHALAPAPLPIEACRGRVELVNLQPQPTLWLLARWSQRWPPQPAPSTALQSVNVITLTHPSIPTERTFTLLSPQVMSRDTLKTTRGAPSPIEIGSLGPVSNEWTLWLHWGLGRGDTLPPQRRGRSGYHW
jgi:hypothetical protein